MSRQCLPENHSVAVCTTSLVTSVTARTPLSEHTVLLFNGCLDYKFGHTSRFSSCLDYKSSRISRCQKTIKSTYSDALQWLLGLQVWSLLFLIADSRGCKLLKAK
ncbi:hypothetical protein TNCV_1953231 [Trichonephila clavipes]|nr:hypothetical protein TNCV_1953231 [Trichonephila clavipes]